MRKMLLEIQTITIWILDDDDDDDDEGKYMGYEPDDVRDIYDNYTDTSAVAAGGIGRKEIQK